MGTVGSRGMGPVRAVLAAGTRKLSTLTQGCRSWGLHLGRGGRDQCDSNVGNQNSCLWLKYYFWRSRSPELGLRPGSVGVRSKRAEGRSPLPRALLGEYVSSGVPENSSRARHFFLWPSYPLPQPSGRSEWCPGDRNLSSAWKTLHQAGISWSFLNPRARSPE